MNFGETGKVPPAIYATFETGLWPSAQLQPGSLIGSDLQSTEVQGYEVQTQPTRTLLTYPPYKPLDIHLRDAEPVKAHTAELSGFRMGSSCCILQILSKKSQIHVTFIRDIRLYMCHNVCPIGF